MMPLTNEPAALTQVFLYGMPMPPSINHAYPTGADGRRRKSREYRLYESDAAKWAMKQNDAIRRARQLASLCGPYTVLSVKACFVFPYAQILCKDGKPKRNDTSNRLKILHDVLGDLLSVDDCYFWEGSFAKSVIYPAERDQNPYVDIILSRVDLDA